MSELLTKGAIAFDASDRLVRLNYEAPPTIHLLHESKALFRGLKGPIGSGKSVGCCFELYRLARSQKPWQGKRKTRWGVVRSTYPELISTTLKTWKDWFPSDICQVREGAPISAHLQMPHPSGDGTEIDMELLFVALEREEDTRKLLSMELTGIWFNEARELPWGIIKDGLGRIGRYPSLREGGHTRKAAIADTNPPDDDHWWYRLAEDGRLNDDVTAVTTDDFEFFNQPPALIKTEDGYGPNPHAENVKNLKDGYRYWLDQVPGRDQQWINVYLLGQYGTVQDGKPVYGASYNDALHCSQVAFEAVKKWPLILTLDFGLTPAAGFMQQTPRGQVRLIEEIITEDCGIRQLCRDMIKPRLLNRYKGCPVFITGDPAGNQRSQNDEKAAYEVVREELAGLFIECVPAISNLLSVRTDAVKQVLGRLSDGKAVFQISPECKVARKGFNGAYKYAKVRVAGGAERYMETPVKNFASHIHDAIQYGVMFILGGLMTQALGARSYPPRPHLAADRVGGY